MLTEGKRDKIPWFLGECPASAGLGNGFIPVLPQGEQNRVCRYSGGGTSQGGFFRPSADSPSAPALQGHPHPPQCAHWGTFPLEGGRLGGKSDVQPLRRIQKPSLLFVGAGHRPARRCTRRVQEAAPYKHRPPPVRPNQAHEWNRTNCNFGRARAQWPGGNLDRHSNFARRK